MRVEVPCLSGGESAGRAVYEETGLRLRFRCVLPGRKGLCKLWLERGEHRMLLGTPAPEGDALVLERNFSRSALESAQVYPPERIVAAQEGENPRSSVPPSQESWSPVTESAPRLEDPLLCRQFRQGGWVWRRWERGVVLCHPWQVNNPFPAAALFCFAHVERTPRGARVCYYLDERGMPVLLR